MEASGTQSNKIIVDFSLNAKIITENLFDKMHKISESYSNFLDKDKKYDLEEFNEVNSHLSQFFNFLQEIDAYEIYTDINKDSLNEMNHKLLDLIHRMHRSTYFTNLIHNIVKKYKHKDLDENALGLLARYGFRSVGDGDNIHFKATSKKINLVSILLRDRRNKAYIRFIDGGAKTIKGNIYRLEEKIFDLSNKYEQSKNVYQRFSEKADNLQGLNLASINYEKDGDHLVFHNLKVIKDIIMTQCHNEKVRLSAFRSVNRENMGKINILVRLLELKRQLAAKKNFPNYFTYTCSNKSGAASIKKFVKIYIKEYKPVLKGYFKSFNAILGTQNDFIYAHDLGYAMNMYAKQNIGLDEEYIYKNFDYTKILSNILEFYNENYRLEMTKSSIKTSSGVVLEKYEFVYKGDLIGHIYLDIRSHKYKSGGNFELSVNRHSEDSYAISIISIESSKGKDKLLTRLTYVDTLFHEIGHAMQNLFARFKYSHITTPPIEFIETLSQIMELFMTDTKVIERIFDVGPEIAKKLYELHKIEEMVTQSSFLAQIMFDIKIHEHVDKYTPGYLSQTWRKCFLKYGLVKFKDGDGHLGVTKFIHIATNAYSGKYYNYLVSQVYAIYLYKRFKVVGAYNTALWAGFAELLKYCCVINPIYVFRWFINGHKVLPIKKSAEPKVDPGALLCSKLGACHEFKFAPEIIKIFNNEDYKY